MSKKITLIEFTEKMNVLVGKKLSHMDPYYQKIDLHFGNYFKSDDEESGDFVLYVSGIWNIKDSRKILLDESYQQSEIVNFFNSHLENIVKDINIFDSPKRIDIVFSEGFTLQVVASDENHWVELLKRNGDLLTYKQDTIVFKQG